MDEAAGGTNHGSMEKPVLEPLFLPEPDLVCSEREDSPRNGVPCLLCEAVPDNRDTYLQHLLLQHKLVIADVNLIANFRSYCMYWKQRFTEQPLTDFCASVKTTKTEGSDHYLLLSDVLPEDKQLRQFIQKKKLEHILETQQKERDDETFSRTCLFCKEHFTGNRSDLFNHMAQDHGFNVGQPDNLVFVNQFLDTLENKLSCLQCLYCEKVFRDKVVLKEHMRKKQHRKINPKNPLYDRFYVINYLELGKNWEKIHQERDITEPDTEDTESEDEWSGWIETDEGQAICLFCDFSSSMADRLVSHMLELHDFDLEEVKLRLNLNFYQQVKLVNYIRRQVHLCVCMCCQARFESRSSLADHMHQEGHTTTLPDISVWDQPQYFFPTYENDNLLCQLDDDDLDQWANDHVIAEDTPVMDTILAEEMVRQDILKPS